MPEKKKGGCLKTLLIIFGVLIVIGVIANILGGDEEDKKKNLNLTSPLLKKLLKLQLKKRLN